MGDFGGANFTNSGISDRGSWIFFSYTPETGVSDSSLSVPSVSKGKTWVKSHYFSGPLKCVLLRAVLALTFYDF